MCQWTGSVLAQIVACHLFYAKPLPEPTLSIGPIGTNFSEIEIKIQNFSLMKMHFENAVCEMAAISQGEMN